MTIYTTQEERQMFEEQRKRIFALYVWLMQKENGNTQIENNDIRFWMDELIKVYATLRKHSDWGKYDDDLYPILTPEDSYSL